MEVPRSYNCELLQVALWMNFQVAELNLFYKKFEDELLKEEEKIKKRYVSMYVRTSMNLRQYIGTYIHYNMWNAVACDA